VRWTTRSPVRLCGSSASDRSCSSARHKCKHDCVHFWPLVFSHFWFSPRFILNYSSVSNPPSEYTVIFVINISLLFVFVLVFLFEVFCAVRRRIVAVKSGESAAIQLFPRLFSNYRYKMRCLTSPIDAKSRHRVMQAKTLEGSCAHSFGEALYSKSECCWV